MAQCYHGAPAASPGTGRAPNVPLFGLAPGEVYPPPMSPPEAVSSYLTISPLSRWVTPSGRYVSVALAIGLPRLGVTQHPCPVELGLSSPMARTSIKAAAQPPRSTISLSCFRRPFQNSLTPLPLGWGQRAEFKTQLPTLRQAPLPERLQTSSTVKLAKVLEIV